MGTPTYAFVSHESAVQGIWAAARREWKGILDDEGIWLLPEASECVHTQRGFVAFTQEVDLTALGILKQPIDLLVPNASAFSRGQKARFHVWKGFMAAHSFIRVHERVLVSTPYFAALQLACARPASKMARADAQTAAAEEVRVRKELSLDPDAVSTEGLLAWDNIARMVRAAQVLSDFAGTYRLPVTSGDEITYQRKPLLTFDAFARYLDESPRAKGLERARRVAALAFEGCASPMETALVLMLTLPVEMGGYGLERPCVNWSIDVPPELRGLSLKQEMSGDLCWPAQKVVIEYDSWEYHGALGPKKLAEDAERANALTAFGWRVIRVTSEQIRTQTGVARIAQQAARLLGVELQTPTDLQRIWRTRLHLLLIARTGYRE